MVDRYFQVVGVLEYELELIEEQIFTKGIERANIESLYQLKRKLMIVKHAVGPLMEAVAKLHGGRVPAICVNTQEYFRDVYDHLYRINFENMPEFKWHYGYVAALTMITATCAYLFYRVKKSEWL